MVTCNNYITVPASQSEVKAMPSHDNQPRHDDERSQVEDSNGMFTGLLLYWNEMYIHEDIEWWCFSKCLQC